MEGLDIEALRETLASEESMVGYYGGVQKKIAVNAALVAAGLEPMYPEASFAWDVQQRERKLRSVAALKAVIAHFEKDAG